MADLEKNKGGGWFGMESTGQWSNGLGSLNPKCHYEYQIMREGVAHHPIHSLDPPLIFSFMQKEYNNIFCYVLGGGNVF